MSDVVGGGDRPIRAFRIKETGDRVNGLEFELQLYFDRWRVVERTETAWTVRTVDGETLTLLVVDA